MIPKFCQLVQLKVFGGDMDPEDSTIALPDLIGWIGGQPIAIGNGINYL